MQSKHKLLIGLALIMGLVICLEIIGIICKAILWILANFAGPIIGLAVIGFILYELVGKDHTSGKHFTESDQSKSPNFHVNKN